MCIRDSTQTGQFLITEMMKRGMLIDVDHMGRKAFDETLSLAESYVPSGSTTSCDPNFFINTCGDGKVCCPNNTSRAGVCAGSLTSCNSSSQGYPILASHV